MWQGRVERLVDPRGVQKRDKLALAARPSLEQLKSGRILFYNNTKLEFCNYSETYTAIKRNLKKLGVANFVDYRETVRGKMTEHLRDLAIRLAKEGYLAAVVGLADMGTTPATAVLAIELEKAGVPCVLISAPPGLHLARQVAFYRGGRLCICPIDIYQASTRREVAAEIDKQMDCIIESLTLPPERLMERSAIEPGMDGVPPSDDGLLPSLPEVPSEELEIAPPGLLMEETMDLFDTLSLGDGLPVVPPTRKRIDAMRAYCPFDPKEVLIPEAGPSGRDILVEDVAINAVMAGCKPEYVPILIAAFRAMANPKYNFLQSVTTSHPGGNLVLVSGPLTKELGIHSGQGCLGPGFRANATIGRAVNLTILHVCRAVPSKADLGCLASPAEYSYCFAEAPDGSPWPTINEERFDAETTTVYVLKAEPLTDVIDFLSQSAVDLLDTFIDSATCLGKNNAYIPGTLIMVFTPDHTKILSRERWDKPKLRQYLYERVHNPKALVQNRGIIPVRPKGFENLSPVPATRSPDDVEIVMAGGRGGHSAIIAPWGLRSEAIVEPVRLPNGKTATSIAEFRS